MKTITLTSQGQITIPAEVRRALDLEKSDQLAVSYDLDNQEIILTKQMGLTELTEFAMSKVDPKAKPVKNVSDYYNKHRQDGIR